MSQPAVYVFDSWLDDSLPWAVEEYTCDCGRKLALVHRVDKYAFCPHCTITDRVTVIREISNFKEQA